MIFIFIGFTDLMHKNKFLYEKVHIIHHKASNPFPADYLYEHPLEWIMGLLGPFYCFFNSWRSLF